MCALPRRRPPSLFPSAAPTRAHPLQSRLPPQALPNPGCRGKESAGKQEGWKSRSEPAVAVPPGRPCGSSAGRTGLGNPRPLQMRWQLLQLWLRRGGRPGPRSPRGRQERSSRRGCAQPLVARRLPLPGSLAGTPGPPRGPGQKQGRKRGSPAVRAALALAPAPGGSAPSRLPRSARISCGCSARASYLRPGRAPATEHAQCRSASPAQAAAPARFHFSRLWRRLREERLEGPGQAGAEREKGGAGGGGRGGGGGTRSECDPCRQRLRALWDPRFPYRLGRRQGGCGGPGCRDAARYPLHVAWRLSAPKGSWVTSSLASLFSHMSAVLYNGKMYPDENCPHPPSCNL